MALLEVENVIQTYLAENGQTLALDNISFDVEKGEILSIVGPSGCGKSTLLSVIAGIIKPDSGSVYVCGRKVTGISENIGYMLQKDNLLEWRTVYQNVVLGLEIQGKKGYYLDRVEELLHKYELYDFKEKYPSQLSGGMRQRAALIRTLAVNPDILLLDEAFSALDYQTRLKVTRDVYEILKEEKVTALMVTHDIPEGISMGDRIMILSQRPASIREIIKLEFENPDRNPLNAREDPAFTKYFNRIWKELSS